MSAAVQAPLILPPLILPLLILVLALIIWPSRPQVAAVAKAVAAARGRSPSAGAALGIGEIEPGRAGLSIGRILRGATGTIFGWSALPLAGTLLLALIAPWPWTVAAGVVAATGTRLVRRNFADVRARRAAASLIDALRALTRELAAGTPAPAALQATAAMAPPDIAGLLRRATLPQLGTLPHQVARAQHAARTQQSARAQQFPSAQQSPQYRPENSSLKGDAAQLAASWDLATAQGLPLADVVSALADDVADRQRTAQTRAAQVAGPAVSGYVLALLPLVGILLGVGMGASPLDVLGNSGLGNALLIAGAVLCCAGLLWTDKIVRG